MAVYKLQIVDADTGEVVQQDDITPIEQVNVKVSQTTGEASGSASYGDGVLDIHLQGIKGETGDDGQRGEKGDTVILGDGQQYTLYNEAGSHTDGAMTQNAVTDELTFYDNIGLSGIEEMSKTINSNNVWGTSSSGNKSMLIPVTKGSTIQVLPLGSLTYAFMTDNSSSGNPAYADGYSNVRLVLESAGMQTLQVPADGTYLYIISAYHNEDRKPQVLRYLLPTVKEKMVGDKSWSDELMLDAVTEIPTDNYYFANNDTFAGNTTQKHAVIPVSKGEKYVVGWNANSQNSVTIVYYATSSACTLNAAIPVVQGTSRMTISYVEKEKIFVIPDRCKCLLIYNGGNLQEYKVKKTYTAADEGEKRTVTPKMAFESVSTSLGEISGNNFDKKILSTQRFVKVNSSFSITSSEAIRVRVLYYDESFAYLGYAPDSDWISITSDTATKINVPPEAQYVKLSFIGTVYEDMTSIPVIKLTGDIPEKWDIFNKRPLDSGYQRIVARVFVTDPTCCDESTDSVQDDGEWLVDYGVIALPPRYSNTGEPTRLIIYCHGAAVNYADNVTRFNTKDLEPGYWLSEGYAVMDIEGNPFDNVNEHICMPQAMDCYVAAYKWTIEHYNIRRDGVFVGGRSMGGMNTFNLSRRECPIPVIAACPNVPAPVSFGYGVGERKAFTALHYGFDIPDGFVFKDNDNMSAEDKAAEKQLLLDNWDKFVKCAPIYGMCTDLPGKDIMLNPTQHGYETIMDVLDLLHAVAKCPIKLFGCYEDSNYRSTTAEQYYKMFINAGQMVEVRLFHSSIRDAHHYDTQDSALRTTITTRYGEELSNIPVVYIEMLRFWRRYDQSEL